MSETLVWWLMMQVVGLATLPLCLTLFSRLPDRGYAFSKAFALILVGYLLWILNVARILPNSSAGIWIVLLALFALSGLVANGRRGELLAFARSRWWLIVAVEIALFLSFITAAYLRTFVGDLGGTEKPMDFMFLNAVTQAERFPPLDPWMAGEKVAYYYFGYLIMSIMTRLSGLDTGIGFNLGVAMTVSLAVVGAFGLVYNMIAPQTERAAVTRPGTPRADFQGRILWRPIAFGFVAAFLLAVVGNLEGLLEALAASGIGGAGFWGWVNIEGLQGYQSAHWYPDNFWFWWRATRILDGSTGIHEFPFFSFLLGDLHPHVMSIPFVLLALAVAQLLLRFEGPLDLVVWLERPLWLAAFAIVLGGLAFINTWDMPTMAFVVALVALVRNRLLANQWSWGLVADTLGFLLPLFLCAFLAYAPFFFGGFDSQASGFKVVSTSGTRLFQALMLWGTFAVIILPYVAWRIVRTGKPTLREIGWSFTPMISLLILWLVWEVVAGSSSGMGFSTSNLLGWLPLPVRPIDVQSGVSFGDRLGARGPNWLTFIALGTVVAVIILALYREVEDAKRTAAERTGHIFALGLAGASALLILGSELFYIFDTFDSRMNTIFKLYYQAWLMLSVAGGFVLYEITQGLQRPLLGPSEDAPNETGKSVRAILVSPEVTASNHQEQLVNAGDELRMPSFAVGDIIVGVATLVGAVGGVALGQDLLTRFTGFVVGGGVFFAFTGTFMVWWQSVPNDEGRGAAISHLTWRGVWAGAAFTVLFAAFLYPVLATYNRTSGFNNQRVLNGLDAISPDQRAAIKYLRDVDGHPVVLEAPGGDYSEFGTISAATALPTLLQWRFHEVQWRGRSQALDEELDRREQAIEAIYTGDTGSAMSMLQQYQVRYIVVGPRELEKYPGITIHQHTDLVQPVLQQGQVTILQVRTDIVNQSTLGDMS